MRFLILFVLAISVCLSDIAFAKWFKLDLQQNELKYKEDSIKPAKGKHEDVEIESRALQNKDNSTTIEVTSGNFSEGSNEFWNLKSVKIKLFKLKKEKTKNGDHNDLDFDEDKNQKEYHFQSQSIKFKNLHNGGYFEVTLPKENFNLTLGQYLKITAKLEKNIARNCDDKSCKNKPMIKDIDTDITQVVLRPDLGIESIESPISSYLNTPIIIDTVIREQNAQIGARGDCELYIDENTEPVSVIQNIWVASGERVNCRFDEYAFNTAGMHSFTVKVKQTDPSDYDDSNNTQTKFIEIKNPVAITWDLNADHYFYKTFIDYSHSYNKGTWTQFTYGEIQNINWNVRADTALTYPIIFSGNLVSDGGSHFSLNETFLVPDSVNPRTLISTLTRRDDNYNILTLRVSQRPGNRFSTFNLNQSASSTHVNIIYLLGELWYSVPEADITSKATRSVNGQLSIQDASSTSFNVNSSVTLESYAIYNGGRFDETDNCDTNINYFCQVFNGYKGTASGTTVSN